MKKTGIDVEDVVSLMSSYVPLIHPWTVCLYICFFTHYDMFMLKVYVADSFKTMESTYQKMWHYILEDMILFTSICWITLTSFNFKI